MLRPLQTFQQSLFLSWYHFWQLWGHRFSWDRLMCTIIANLSIGDGFTGDWRFSMWVSFQWNWFALLCCSCTYLVRATIDCGRSVMGTNFTSNILVWMWCTSAAAPTTTITQLRYFMRGALTRQGRVPPTLGEMMRTLHVAFFHLVIFLL